MNTKLLTAIDDLKKLVKEDTKFYAEKLNMLDKENAEFKNGML